jgi:hypothetical protein
LWTRRKSLAATPQATVHLQQQHLKKPKTTTTSHLKQPKTKATTTTPPTTTNTITHLVLSWFSWVHAHTAGCVSLRPCTPHRDCLHRQQRVCEILKIEHTEKKKERERERERNIGKVIRKESENNNNSNIVIVIVIIRTKSENKNKTKHFQAKANLKWSIERNSNYSNIRKQLEIATTTTTTNKQTNKEANKERNKNKAKTKKIKQWIVVLFSKDGRKASPRQIAKYSAQDLFPKIESHTKTIRFPKIEKSIVCVWKKDDFFQKAKSIKVLKY